jgi:hypothetical protein
MQKFISAIGSLLCLSVSLNAWNLYADETNSPSSLSSIDYTSLQPPPVGANALHVLAPNLLELIFINTKAADPASVTNWNFVNNGSFSAPLASAFKVTANGQAIAISAIGFKRRPLWAPFQSYDLRVENSLYLQLASSVSTNQTVEVANPEGSLWPSSMAFSAQASPLRYSPAIHVNQEGYLPNYTKQAMVGYYLGSLGEMSIPASTGFSLVDANSGAQVFQGSLAQRTDTGFTYSPTPYQQVYMADFTSFNTPGQYQLVVPGLGASLPFSINNGVAMDFARAYALGLFHQRCGANLGLPYTRFQHADCHAAPASVPASASAFPFTWTTVSGYASQVNSANPTQVAPLLTSPAAQLFPYQNQGTVDVSGGHHDAGDYSKYTINSASLVHYLMFEVDSLPGVASFDNLGIPESGDGISDILQECKWEADFLAKMQDSDGGFYFLVYPQNREYEISVPPNEGDPQVVWPKNSSVTAASVAALAQCASSPAFKKAYPAAAATYLQKAQLGWKFLTDNIAKYGKGNFYQKITFYGDDWADNDEMAWAACQMFLATGDQSAHQDLLAWFNPNDASTWRWGWWHMSECWGHAIRSYAFAVQSGRVASTDQLNPAFLAACQQQIQAAGDDVLNFSQQSAYGTSLPTDTKAAQSPGWYFSCDQAFDLAVAYQINPNPAYLSAIIANMNYEGGCNPLNLAFVAGLGWKRQHNFVSQWEVNAPRQLPPSGLPVGNIHTAFTYLWNYAGELEELAFPSDGATSGLYPFYDRWGDSWNVSTEMVCLNSARALGALAFLAAQTGYATQPWTAPVAQINVPSGVVPVGSNVTLTLQGPAGLDLSGARIVWEAQDQQPAFGPSFTYAPVNNGAQWVEAEAQLPDGRRVFATNTFLANAANIVWFNGAVPAGATTGADGGDAWTWVTSNPTPYAAAKDLESSVASGEHQIYFYGASNPLSVDSNSTLYAWVYLNPKNTPSEVMLQWYDGSSWEHRAYWGANSLSFGVAGTVSRYDAGALPAAGQWVQLEVPASAVGLQGATVTGMSFALYGGQATWDEAGVLNAMSALRPDGTTSVVGLVSTNGSGTYHGLFYNQNEVTPGSSGSITLTVTPKKSYSGSLQIGAARYPLSGRINGAGTSTASVRAPKGKSLSVSLSFDPENGQVTGTVSGGSWSAPLAAGEAIYNSRKDKAPFSARYTLVIPGSPGGGPQGNGYGAIQVRPSGQLTLSGALADGTALAESATLVVGGQWPLYVPLYRGEGMIVGWLTLDTNQLTGTLSWIKPAMTSTKSYSGGFTNAAVAAIGSSYSRATASMAALTNSAAVFAGGTLNVSANAATPDKESGVLKDTSPQFTLHMASETGILSGKAIVPGTGQDIPFHGALLQNQSAGYGYFLDNEQSGSVILGSGSGAP